MRFSIPAIRPFQRLCQPAFFSRQTSWDSRRGSVGSVDGPKLSIALSMKEGDGR